MQVILLLSLIFSSPYIFANETEDAYIAQLDSISLTFSSTLNVSGKSSIIFQNASEVTTAVDGASYCELSGFATKGAVDYFSKGKTIEEDDVYSSTGEIELYNGMSYALQKYIEIIGSEKFTEISSQNIPDENLEAQIKAEVAEVRSSLEKNYQEWATEFKYSSTWFGQSRATNFQTVASLKQSRVNILFNGAQDARASKFSLPTVTFYLRDAYHAPSRFSATCHFSDNKFSKVSDINKIFPTTIQITDFSLKDIDSVVDD